MDPKELQLQHSCNFLFAEQTVPWTGTTGSTPLKPIRTEDGSVSLEPNLVYSYSSYYYYLGLSFKCKCPYPDATVQWKIISSPSKSTLAEASKPLQPQMDAVTTRLDASLSGGTVLRVQISVSIRQPTTGIVLYLNQARQDGTHSDVKLVVEGVELNAHRMVLALRSPVLCEILTEKTSIRVEVADFSLAAVNKFLEFLYTDRVENWEDSEVKLLELAEKYLVRELKTECILRLKDSDPLKAVKVLQAAGLRDFIGRDLRRRLTATVMESMATVAKSQEWAEFESTWPIIADSIIGPTQDKQKPASNSYCDCPKAVGVRLCLNQARLDGTLCDVKLVVEGEELDAHRVVLAPRSPVLSSMLTGTFKEAREGRVEVVDCSKDAVEKFLEFLYTDRVESWEGSEVELLQLADKYLVPELRDECEHKLWDYSPVKAVRVLYDASLSEVLSGTLRRRLSKIVAVGMDTLSNNDDWLDLEADFSVVADSILGFKEKTSSFFLVTK